MHFPALVLPALAVLGSAQSTTVISVFEAFVNDAPHSASISWYTSIGASIAGTNADYTTYEIDCMSNAPTSECRIDAPYTIIAGPTTLSYSRPVPVDAYGTTVTVIEDVKCSFTHKTESAVCTNSDYLFYDGQSTSTVITKSIPTGDVLYRPITVTGGLSRFNGPQATQPPNAAGGLPQPLVTAAPLGAAAALAAAALY